jgi:hypothetical protein
MHISDEAVEAGKLGLLSYYGVDPDSLEICQNGDLHEGGKLVVAILEAAAPHLMAEALREAADDAKDPSVRDMDAYHIDQADVWLWLRNRAVDVELAAGAGE